MLRLLNCMTHSHSGEANSSTAKRMKTKVFTAFRRTAYWSQYWARKLQSALWHSNFLTYSSYTLLTYKCFVFPSVPSPKFLMNFWSLPCIFHASLVLFSISRLLIFDDKKNCEYSDHTISSSILSVPAVWSKPSPKYPFSHTLTM